MLRNDDLEGWNLLLKIRVYSNKIPPVPVIPPLLTHRAAPARSDPPFFYFLLVYFLLVYNLVSSYNPLSQPVQYDSSNCILQGEYFQSAGSRG